MRVTEHAHAYHVIKVIPQDRSKIKIEKRKREINCMNDWARAKNYKPTLRMIRVKAP